MSRRGVLRCLAAAVLFGASTPLASRLVGTTSALTLAGLLYLGAGLAVLPVAVAHRPASGAWRRSWRPLGVSVVAGGALGPALLVAGLARTSPATASLLLNLELVATAVLARALFGEHLGRRVVAAVALVTAGGVVLAWAPGAGLDTGALLVAAACLCWGVDNNVTARIDQIGPAHVTLAKGLVAGPANLVLGLVVLGGGLPDARSVAAALAIGAAGYGLSITLWVQGARDLGAARGQVIFATAPFVGAVVAWTVLGAPVTLAQVVAGALAGVGVALSLRSAHEHEHHHGRVRHEHEHTHDDLHHDHPHPAGVTGPHTHVHEHAEVVHRHPHVPDLHHRHDHDHGPDHHHDG